MRYVITRIDRDILKQQRPVIVRVTQFDQLGREQLSMSIPVHLFRGELGEGQELIFAPKEQADLFLKKN